MADLLGIINEGKRGPSFFMGEVIKASPIQINSQGLPLYKDDLMIDELIKKSGLNKNDRVLLYCLGEKYLIVSKVVEI